MKRVLILDNDRDVLDVMKEALIYEDFKVSWISEGSTLFAVLALYKPDLLIVDYVLDGMDGMNGGELCARVKGDPQTFGLPIIIVSAHPYERLSLDTYGCDDFITKPFELYYLLDRIKKLTYKGLHIV